MRMDKTIAVVVIAFPILIFSACMTNYGRFSINAQVKQDFLNGVIQPDLQYYYTGRPNLPHAIIGIDRTYSVPSMVWIAFDPDTDQLRKISRKIFGAVQNEPFGADILAPDGRTIGIWYSKIFNFSVREDPQQRTLDILFVNPEKNDRPGW